MTDTEFNYEVTNVYGMANSMNKGRSNILPHMACITKRWIQSRTATGGMRSIANAWVWPRPPCLVGTGMMLLPIRLSREDLRPAVHVGILNSCGGCKRTRWPLGSAIGEFALQSSFDHRGDLNVEDQQMHRPSNQHRQLESYQRMQGPASWAWEISEN